MARIYVNHNKRLGEMVHSLADSMVLESFTSSDEDEDRLFARLDEGDHKSSILLSYLTEHELAVSWICDCLMDFATPDPEYAEAIDKIAEHLRAHTNVYSELEHNYGWLYVQRRGATVFMVAETEDELSKLRTKLIHEEAL